MTIKEPEGGGSKAPIFGDGSDGSITRAANGNENGIINATDYTLQSGVTRTVTNGVLVVLATESITIEGTIDADHQGGAGGPNGGDTGDGQDGEDSTYIAGGDGGNSGTNPGAGGTPTLDTTDGITQWPCPALWHSLALLAIGGGGGGGGAGGGNSLGRGGDGGDGGGVIILAAPSITVTGTLTAQGQDGTDGLDEGGGGGGGGGGLIGIFGRDLTTGSMTTTVGGGAGGSSGPNGGNDGSPGSDGVVKEVAG